MSVAATLAPVPVNAQDVIRVMIVDDAVVVRGLVSRWIDEEAGLKTVASLRTGRDAVEQVLRHNPDVVILDIEMPDMDGIEALPLLLEKKRDLIVIMDVNGNFLYISDSVTHILGYGPADLIGKNAFDLIHKADAEKVFLELQKVIGRDETASGIQHRFLNSDGEWIWLESKGSNHLSDGSISGIIINARDITDRMRLQLKLDEERANRQKQITEFAAEPRP